MSWGQASVGMMIILGGSLVILALAFGSVGYLLDLAGLPPEGRLPLQVLLAGVLMIVTAWGIGKKMLPKKGDDA